MTAIGPQAQEAGEYRDHQQQENAGAVAIADVGAQTWTASLLKKARIKPASLFGTGPKAQPYGELTGTLAVRESMAQMRENRGTGASEYSCVWLLSRILQKAGRDVRPLSPHQP